MPFSSLLSEQVHGWSDLKEDLRVVHELSSALKNPGKWKWQLCGAEPVNFNQRIRVDIVSAFQAFIVEILKLRPQHKSHKVELHAKNGDQFIMLLWGFIMF